MAACTLYAILTRDLLLARSKKDEVVGLRNVLEQKKGVEKRDKGSSGIVGAKSEKSRFESA